MKDEEYEKKLKGTKTFCIIIGILFALGIFISVSQQNYINAVLSLAFLILLYLFYSFTKKKKIIGPVIGIILGILYILELNILTIVMGIFILIDCISMLKYIREINK